LETDRKPNNSIFHFGYFDERCPFYEIHEKL